MNMWSNRRLISTPKFFSGESEEMGIDYPVKICVVGPRKSGQSSNSQYVLKTSKMFPLHQHIYILSCREDIPV